jgi:hypothetical protein
MGFLRRLGRIASGAVRGVQKATSAVAGVLGKADQVLKSPVGQIVMAGLAANPKTRGASMKLQEAVSQGANISNVVAGLSRGDQEAVAQAVQMASQRSLGN